MSGIYQIYYPSSLLNLTESNSTSNNNSTGMDRSNNHSNNNINNNNGYLIEMGDYPINIRNNSPLPPSSSSTYFIKLWSNTYLDNLITQNDRLNILNYKNTISLNFTLLLILTSFFALTTVTLTEYFSYQFNDSKLHWVTVFIAFCCSLMIICQACMLVTRLRKIHEWEDHYEDLRIANGLDTTAENECGNSEELVGEIPPTYQKAREDPPAYGSPIKISLRN
ncbi:hypothetical protein CONCODRAFT_2283 [Conidiobolus coronatus NRRL 28638]|uniref:Uncharacterized protein n=1 Tax=Conidiobolus coronatus (strain ATCC 28846 / CBS 209.66 / NRRL 28638) TaxID=796925 RepID=A0A137PIB0_CONC2|nr:hypothetical protein CONCODRAFT_2283 [Conidiobolus coronatus NRRL 28638]|eukprot:KXN74719.1 hypothetical protein CONCODRAFT_2283 [Conidiobolus coronatus NRRL 28638]